MFKNKKMLGGGGVDRVLSTQQNNKNEGQNQLNVDYLKNTTLIKDKNVNLQFCTINKSLNCKIKSNQTSVKRAYLKAIILTITLFLSLLSIIYITSNNNIKTNTWGAGFLGGTEYGFAFDLNLNIDSVGELQVYEDTVKYSVSNRESTVTNTWRVDTVVDVSDNALQYFNENEKILFLTVYEQTVDANNIRLLYSSFSGLYQSINSLNVNKKRFVGLKIVLPTASTAVIDSDFSNSNEISSSLSFELGSSGNFADGYLLQAQWEDLQNITLNKDGGEGGDIEIIVGLTTKLPTVTQITPPTKSGYNFMGYYYNGTQYITSSGEVIQDSNLYQTIPTSLTAVWQAQSYDITLSNDGGSGESQLQVNNGAPNTTKITPPTKNGYRFLGYYKEDNTTSQQYIDSEGNVNQDSSLYSTPITTLYAQWEEITYNIDYYIVLDGVSTKWSEGNTNALTYTINTSSFSINLPIVDSRYEYVGWSRTEGGTTTTTTPTINQGTTGNKSYYFVYKTKTLTLKLNCTNYVRQNYFVYIYRGSELIYQLYVQKGVTLELGYIDYTQEKYTIQFVMSYLGSVSCSGANITQSGRRVTINEFVDTTINYTIISPNINGGIIV